jgi:uncharacterized membrane protein
MIRIFLLSLFLAFPAFSQGFPALYDVSGVAANDVLNIRANTDFNAPVIGTLAPDATGVEVVGLSSDGKWGRVNSGESSGWVALRFLDRQSGPEWISLDRPMTCSGTEPFWSLAYSPDRRNMMLSRMGEDHDLGLWINWHMETEGRMGQIGWHLSGPAREGFATLTAESCNDGMSDRAFGLSITLFMNAADESAAPPLGLAGCCSLSR